MHLMSWNTKFVNVKCLVLFDVTLILCNLTFIFVISVMDFCSDSLSGLVFFRIIIFALSTPNLVLLLHCGCITQMIDYAWFLDYLKHMVNSVEVNWRPPWKLIIVIQIYPCKWRFALNLWLSENRNKLKITLVDLRGQGDSQ